MRLSAVLLLAVGISLDGFAAGVAYGLKCIRVPLVSLWIVSFSSGVAVLIAMGAGAFLDHYLDGFSISWVGAFLLIGLGLWSILAERREASLVSAIRTQGIEQENMILNLRLQPFGLIIQVLTQPLAADLDCSGMITGWEALLLGAALAVDAIGVGIAAALVGFPLTATCISVTVLSFVALSGGLLVGRYWAKRLVAAIPLWSYVPGLILIGIGLWWLITLGR